ncbi:hypothetical protein KIH27_03410 [Mycobacterium sp. M1]|uniref:Uncharacterized protein n=1 Tax=Mycolicibacter acidiphilus TaxID=2835306 RepID=A0ABS5REB6_9MYCO|nr:hypothetical protein [Mycolicibacter acidiphilus]MBS9532631.1 hypothetical protein [Mycolicibacter acidiphilus]
MSAIGEQVWLVTVTTEPIEPTHESPSLTGYFIHSSLATAAERLRETLVELGIGDLSPDSFELELDDDVYHGSRTIGDQQVSYKIFDLTVGE